jgi:hypothetical protein
MLRPDRKSASIRSIPSGMDIYYERLPLNGRLVCSVALGPLCESIEVEISDLATRAGFADLAVSRVADGELT